MTLVSTRDGMLHQTLLSNQPKCLKLGALTFKRQSDHVIALGKYRWQHKPCMAQHALQLKNTFFGMDLSRPSELQRIRHGLDIYIYIYIHI